MKPNAIHILFYFLLTCLSPLIGIAQDDCGDRLRQAQRSFDSGFPEAVSDLIEDCLNQKRFGREEELQALRLLTIVQLYEQDKKADVTFQRLLHRNPEFRIDTSLQSDPGELVFLYDEFRTNPRAHIRYYGGLNQTLVRELQFVSSGKSNEDSKVYGRLPGIQAGLMLGIPLFTRNLRLQIGAEYAQYEYSLDNTLNTYFGDLPSDAPSRTGSPDFFRVTLTEAQQYLQVPVLLSLDLDRWSPYNFHRNKVVPFLYVGIINHTLLSASYREISRESGVGSFLSSSSFGNILEQRYATNFSLSAGGGVKIKIGTSYFTLDLRYSRWLQNIVDTENRYVNSELIYRYGHVDSDLTFDVMAASIGYEIPYYSPKRRRRFK